MECLKHKDMVVLWGFSEGDCEKCGERVHTHYTPCKRICPKCSEEHDLCEVCGEKIVDKRVVLQHSYGENQEVKEKVEINYYQPDSYFSIWFGKWSHTFDGDGKLIYSTDLLNTTCGK